jgi:Xaa-Pro aminopeptidase
MAGLLLYGDTERSAALRHEIPIAIGDPFLWTQTDERTIVVVNALERGRIAAACPEVDLIGLEDLGFHELLRSGRPREDVLLELGSRAVARIGLRDALVDPAFPVALADRLRADGVQLTPDHETFAARRRVKSGAEMAGILRAQAAAQDAMGAAAALLRSARIDGEHLRVDGAPLTAEAVRAVLRATCGRHDTPAPADIIVASVWQGFGHDPGRGPLPAHRPIQIDLWPRDEASACWADMTRTFVVGEVDAATRAQEELVTEALRRVRAAIRPGVTGAELHGLACDAFEAAGHRTQRTGPGDDPEEGFQFSLGHGVGLELHEEPGLGPLGRAPLVAGDVLAVEPGLWQRGVGGVRVEDLMLVTDDGCRVLTDYPYALAP